MCYLLCVFFFIVFFLVLLFLLFWFNPICYFLFVLCSVVCIKILLNVVKVNDS